MASNMQESNLTALALAVDSDDYVTAINELSGVSLDEAAKLVANISMSGRDVQSMMGAALLKKIQSAKAAKTTGRVKYVHHRLTPHERCLLELRYPGYNLNYDRATARNNHALAAEIRRLDHMYTVEVMIGVKPGAKNIATTDGRAFWRTDFGGAMHHVMTYKYWGTHVCAPFCGLADGERYKHSRETILKMIPTLRTEVSRHYADKFLSENRTYVCHSVGQKCHVKTKYMTAFHSLYDVMDIVPALDNKDVEFCWVVMHYDPAMLTQKEGVIKEYGLHFRWLPYNNDEYIIFWFADDMQNAYMHRRDSFFNMHSTFFMPSRFQGVHYVHSVKELSLGVMISCITRVNYTCGGGPVARVFTIRADDMVSVYLPRYETLPKTRGCFALTEYKHMRTIRFITSASYLDEVKSYTKRMAGQPGKFTINEIERFALSVCKTRTINGASLVHRSRNISTDEAVMVAEFCFHSVYRENYDQTRGSMIIKADEDLVRRLADSNARRLLHNLLPSNLWYNMKMYVGITPTVVDFDTQEQDRPMSFTDIFFGVNRLYRLQAKHLPTSLTLIEDVEALLGNNENVFTTRFMCVDEDEDKKFVEQVIPKLLPSSVAKLSFNDCTEALDVIPNDENGKCLFRAAIHCGITAQTIPTQLNQLRNSPVLASYPKEVQRIIHSDMLNKADWPDGNVISLLAAHFHVTICVHLGEHDCVQYNGGPLVYHMVKTGDHLEGTRISTKLPPDISHTLNVGGELTALVYQLTDPLLNLKTQIYSEDVTAAAVDVDPLKNLKRGDMPSITGYKAAQLGTYINHVPNSAALDVCGGPGGSAMYLCSMYQTVYGVTKPDHIDYSPKVKAISNLEILYGHRDNPDGDITRANNRDAIVGYIRDMKRPVTLAFCDGAMNLDVSSLVDNYDLIVDELRLSLRVLEPAGSLVIKSWDAYHPLNYSLVSLLTSVFAKARVIKPFICKRQGGEFFFLCTDFQLLSEKDLEVYLGSVKHVGQLPKALVDSWDLASNDLINEQRRGLLELQRAVDTRRAGHPLDRGYPQATLDAIRQVLFPVIKVGGNVCCKAVIYEGSAPDTRAVPVMLIRYNFWSWLRKRLQDLFMWLYHKCGGHVDRFDTATENSYKTINNAGQTYDIIRSFGRVELREVENFPQPCDANLWHKLGHNDSVSLTFESDVTSVEDNIQITVKPATPTISRTPSIYECAKASTLLTVPTRTASMASFKTEVEPQPSTSHATQIVARPAVIDYNNPRVKAAFEFKDYVMRTYKSERANHNKVWSDIEQFMDKPKTISPLMMANTPTYGLIDTNGEWLVKPARPKKQLDCPHYQSFFYRAPGELVGDFVLYNPRETYDHIRLVSDYTALGRDGAIFYNLEAAIPYLANVGFEVELEAMVPGGGKTTKIIDKANANVKNNETTIILTNTTAAKLMIRGRFGKMSRLVQVRTLNNVLSGLVNQTDNMSFDECILAHGGGIVFAAVMADIKRLYMSGDFLQINWVNYLSFFEALWANPAKLFKVTSVSSHSYRCPLIVCAALYDQYEALHRSFGHNVGILSCTGVMGQADLEFITGAVDVPLDWNVQYIVQLQTEKTLLMSEFKTRAGMTEAAVCCEFAKNHRNPPMTVNEYQGGEAPHVCMVRLNTYVSEPLYIDDDAKPYAISAVTRFRETFVYYTPLDIIDVFRTVVDKMNNLTDVELKRAQGPLMDKVGKVGSVIVDDVPLPRHFETAERKTLPLTTLNYSDRRVQGYRSTLYFKNIGMPSRHTGRHTAYYMPLRFLTTHVRNKRAMMEQLGKLVPNGDRIHADITPLVEKYNTDGFDHAGEFANLFYRYVNHSVILTVHCDLPYKTVHSNIQNILTFNCTSSQSNQEIILHYPSLPNDIPLDPINKSNYVLLQFLVDECVGTLYRDKAIMMDQLHHSDMNLQVESRISLDGTKADVKYAHFDKLRPIINSPAPMTVPRSQLIKTLGFIKRNDAVLQGRGTVSVLDQAREMNEAFVRSYLNMDKFKTFVHTINSSYEGLVEVFDKQHKSVVENLFVNRGLHEKDLSRYLFDIRTTLKVYTSASEHNTVPKTQTIVCAEKDTTALFSEIFRYIMDITLASLNEGVYIYSHTSAETFADTISVERPPSIAEEGDCWHEVDFSKYDKSQDETDLLAECEYMHFCLVRKEFVDLWYVLNSKSRFVDPSGGFTADILWQMHSGGANTLGGNTRHNMRAMATTQDLSKIKIMAFCGDDGSLFGKMNMDVRRFMVSFNLEAKYAKRKYTSFCSKFLLPYSLVRWVFVPDGIKQAIKIGREDIQNPFHRESYGNSYRSNMTLYGNLETRVLASAAMQERYGTDVDFSELLVELYYLCDKDNFDNLYELVPGTKIDYREKQYSER